MTSSYQVPANPIDQPIWTPVDDAGRSTCWLNSVRRRFDLFQRRNAASRRVYPRLPETSQERRDASLIETPLFTRLLTQSDVSAAEEKGKTVLYLAYGSNLCSETFRGVRGIKPLSQINVVVPSLRLTFDLPGIPYTEPCFANTAQRDPDSTSPVRGSDYHKDRWHKGLVGVVYEVTPTDYAHIIATEGGGASYQDILVDCHPLPDLDTVPELPTTASFKAHTLFAPATEPTAQTGTNITSRFTRPDPSYAQPSARYLKLITDGAAELSFPTEYQTYLNDIRPYTITSKRQVVGKTLFLSVWMPFITLLFSLNAKFQDKDGKSPKWLANFAATLFFSMWVSYDGVFKRAFGDGERAETDDRPDPRECAQVEEEVGRRKEDARCAVAWV